MSGPPYVAVAGPGSAQGDQLELAESVGRGLAERGAVVVCGGLGGVMEAACRGAERAGGTTLGILPGAERSQANPHLTVAVATGLGEARNALVVRAADALIAIAGGWGTLSEIALARKAGKAVIGLGTWELGQVDERPDGIERAPDAATAVRSALAAAEGLERP